MNQEKTMYRFLLVDDSRLTRRLMKRALESLGIGECQFIEAENGYAALGKLEQAGYSVDVIFCDLYMPDMGGLAFLDSLRARGMLESCPVVVLTGDISKDGGEKAVACGAREWIGKPFTAESVKGVLDRVLGTP